VTATGYPRTFGSYVLLDRLGEGGMSEVDLARRAVDDAGFVRFLVIKRIHTQHQTDDSFVRMFHDEARINAELQHENIASVYDFGQEGDEFFLAMEYVPGCDLRRLQRRLAKEHQPFPLPIVLRICADVLAALDYAHHRVDTYGRSMNIVHRDVNPRNIMLSVRGEVKLIDFGVAKADNRAEHTVGHSLKGKFAYMAPEQIEGGRKIDGRADVFALAIVLYELLMGCSPVAGLNEVQTMHRILSGQLPPVRSTPERPIPAALVAAHARASATRPDDRFATAGEMRAALQTLAAECGGVASNRELSTFLAEIDPDIGSVSSRLEVLRDESTEELSRSKAAPPMPLEPISSPGTLASGSRSRSRTRTVDAPTVAAAAGAGALVGVVVLLVGAFVVAWLLSNRGAQQDDPRPVPAASVAEPSPSASPVEAPNNERPAANEPTAAPVRADAAPYTATPPQAKDAPATQTPPASGDMAAAADGGPAEISPASSQSSASTTTTAGRADAGSAADTPAADTPAADTPAADTPAADTPAADTPADDTPAADTPADDTTADDVVAAGSAATGTAAADSTTTSNPSDATPPVAGATGFVNISSRPTGLTVRIDGRAAGTSPMRAVELPAGHHVVAVTDPASGQTWQQDVDVTQGRTQLILLGAPR